MIVPNSQSISLPGILLAIFAITMSCSSALKGQDAFDDTLAPPAVVEGEEVFAFPLDQDPLGTDPPEGDQQEFVFLDEPAPAFSSGEWLFSGGWYLQEDVVFLQKTVLDEQPLASDGTADGMIIPPLILSTESDKPGYEPGGRITLGKIYGRDAWNRDHMIEFRFFGLFDWSTQAGIVRTQAIPGLGINTLLGPPAGDVLALFGNESQRVITHSSLDSYELNLRMRTRGSRDRMVLQHDGQWIRHQTKTRIWSSYAGLTTLSVDEQFDLLGVGPGATRGQLIVSTSNDLFGIHFGGEYIEQATLWNWGLRGRIAGLTNFVDRSSSFTSKIGAAAPTTRAENSEKHHLSFLLEGGIFTSIQLHENATLRVGYDILYLSGLAEATGNINLPVGNFAPLNVNGDLLYLGGSAGLTVVW